MAIGQWFETDFKITKCFSLLFSNCYGVLD